MAITCPTCEDPVALLIFAPHAMSIGELEDHARLMYHNINTMNLPTWILGKEEERHQQLQEQKQKEKEDKKKKKKEIKAALTWLYESFPDCFNLETLKPLKLILIKIFIPILSKKELHQKLS